ncbi:hypothetical protein [Myxococcus sp. RHSTA-1-4]|uniref:hypothetical protein n=1 Tax=Myxococcus sp. RHSTA-1-4 TaxID=2874601 RepID=UPI001CC03E08|nr:hypothetical protein [Myxococcus sp. RHSTA-1-4]MBZ4419085.1 hypothetical protein [Myxococcus sp. RHSTA-1-4]
MLKAELHNKLPDDTRIALDRLEDLLTSNLLGSLTYLPAEHVLLPWLRHARAHPSHVTEPLVPDGVLGATVLFWPRAGTREADALVLLQLESRTEAILVECKYESGKSNAAISEDSDGKAHGDQLVDYWRALAGDGIRPSRSDTSATRAPIQGVKLVYVTAHGTMPVEDMAESWKQLTPEEQSLARFYWLSWRDLHALVTREPPRQPAPGDTAQRNLRRDLAALLERKSLLRFRGFDRLASTLPPVSSSPAWRERWSLGPPPFLQHLK